MDGWRRRQWRTLYDYDDAVNALLVITPSTRSVHLKLEKMMDHLCKVNIVQKEVFEG